MSEELPNKDDDLTRLARDTAARHLFGDTSKDEAVVMVQGDRKIRERVVSALQQAPNALVLVEEIGMLRRHSKLRIRFND